MHPGRTSMNLDYFWEDTRFRPCPYNILFWLCSFYQHTYRIKCLYKTMPNIDNTLREVSNWISACSLKLFAEGGKIYKADKICLGKNPSTLICTLFSAFQFQLLPTRAWERATNLIWPLSDISLNVIACVNLRSNWLALFKNFSREHYVHFAITVQF